MNIDYSDIKKLIKILDKTKITELEISDGEQSIRLSQGNAVPVVANYAPSTEAVMAPDAVVVDSGSAPAKVQAVESVDQKPLGFEVKSPMVGTIYRSPSPNDAPFVEVGQTVKTGETLCIIEAMKMMNQIEAEVSGKILAILVENGTPVEYDQPLIVIEEG